MKHIKIYIVIAMITCCSCDKLTNLSNVINEQETKIAYINKNVLTQMSHIDMQVNNINLISRFDTLTLKSLMTGKYTVLLHLSGLYCSKCNKDLLYYCDSVFNNSNKMIVFGTNISPREAFVLFEKDIYIAEDELTSISEDSMFPYIALIDSSLNQRFIFIPDMNYTSYMDTCLFIVDNLLYSE